MRTIAWAGVMLTCAGCAARPNVSAELPLRRVVVYRNGVGYFERAGHVGDERVKFRMRQRLVGDFLASLAVIERGGSSVRSASFPLEVAESENPAPSEPSPEPRPLPAAGARPEPIPPTPEPPKKKPDPSAMRDVVLHLDGKEHELSIGYLSETPVWRPSYRVVVTEDGSADLQAWGIVQNLSGEDWSQVSLSLVAGAPLAFQSTLGTPVLPERPVVTDQGEVVAAIPTGVTSLDKSRAAADVDRYGPQTGYGYSYGEAAPPAPEPMEAREEDAKLDAANGGGALRKRTSASASPARLQRPNASPAPAAPPPPPPKPSLSAPRRLSDLAAVALESGTTRYDLPYPVSVPNASATMVLLASQRVPGGAVLLYAPEGGVSDSSAHPFRVARFTNSTPGLLERGPIAVFEKGSFLGQGVLEPLPPRATATVPFAIERSVAVAQDYRQDEQGARLYRLEAGRIWLERDFSLRRIYRIDNGSDHLQKILIKHTRAPGTRLFKPPAGTEDNLDSGAALIPSEVRAHGKTELVVDERRPAQEEADWLNPLAEQAVQGYIADARHNAELATKLKEVLGVRSALRTLLDEVERLESEQSELERTTEETRSNLKAIEKNPQAADLRQKLTKRLADGAQRLDAISKRRIELGLRVSEQQVRFRDAVRELKLDAPLPPPA